MVNKAAWQSPQGEVEVAVKVLREGSMMSNRIKFLQEAAIMGQFKHPNIVQLYGVVIAGQPVSSKYIAQRRSTVCIFSCYNCRC